MFNKGKLDVISFNNHISTTKERKHCTTCRAFIGFVNSLLEYEHSNTGSDLYINVLNDGKPTFGFFATKGNLSSKLIFAQMQSTKFKKLRIIYTKGKIFW